MRNVYKDLSIFKCIHEAHEGFENQMSAHHILNKKKCFPHGCFSFRGECKLFNQGKPCYRKYNYIGKNCVGCRYFYEEKIHNRSELQVSEAEYESFRQELKEFEDWLEEHVNREWDIEGVVDGVKPLFRKNIYDKGEGISFAGFLIIFRELFIGYAHMEDYVYARVSTKTYNSLKLGRGDKVSARATLQLDNGRLVFTRLRRIDIHERGETPLWNESRARVARETASHIPWQPEGCLRCPLGALIDVEDRSRGDLRRYRHLYCLDGVANPLVCPKYPGFVPNHPAKSARAKPATCQVQSVNVNL